MTGPTEGVDDRSARRRIGSFQVSGHRAKAMRRQARESGRSRVSPIGVGQRRNQDFDCAVAR